jgi:hypothetical protein
MSSVIGHVVGHAVIESFAICYSTVSIFNFDIFKLNACWIFQMYEFTTTEYSLYVRVDTVHMNCVVISLISSLEVKSACVFFA